MGYLADFFTWEKKSQTEMRAGTGEPRYQCSTQAMLLKDARIPLTDGAARENFILSEDGTSSQSFVPPVTAYQPEGTRVIKHWDDPAATWDEPAALRGGKVFTENCMVCHSSKQPVGYEIAFARNPPKITGTLKEILADNDKLTAPAAGSEELNRSWRDDPADGGKLTMPYAFADWEDFKHSPAYADYLARARPMTGEGDWGKMRAFLKDNYLSTDLRIPVSLTETNPARAVGTNALKGHVWSEFASETYQKLPPVGKLGYTDPISRRDAIWEPPGDGPGYYRVPTLVSIWTSAPLLHNNTLGGFIDEDVDLRVSVKGRLDMFDDAINKLLWKAKRGLTPSGLGGLRGGTDSTWYGGDPGWIYRTDVETELRIPEGHLRRLVTGVLPGMLPGFAGTVALALLDHPWIAPLLLALLSLALILFWPRAFFYLLVLSGIVVMLILWVTGIHYLLPGIIWLLPLALLAGGIAWILTPPRRKPAATPEDSPAPVDRSIAAKWRCAGYRVARWGGLTAYAVLLIGLLALLWTGREFVNGHLGDLRVGPFPKGMPVNALMNFNPEAPLSLRLAALRGMCDMLGTLRAQDEKERASEEARRVMLDKDPSIPQEKLPPLYRFDEAARLKVFDRTAGPALMKASKCPDFVEDEGHYFGESLTDQEKKDLIAFLKTL
jgi:mono/diheme cytochrome c family protein